ncbi:MAG TPA: 5-oxoprolinase subunit PxpA [Hyphomonas sp.]|nr:LamB/YcsF family protein [Hyphomonas sp.]HRJ01307.1 5-oxoprolinase subunit PxpA [Hyphomonas sp.]
MMRSICLNADLGELPGAEGRALDAAILNVVTRCNVACGGHAGNVVSMRETVQRAADRGVRIGAHPSYPDKENFGRVSLKLAPGDLATSLDNQIAELLRIAAEEGATVAHLKPHGALYNDAARDTELSRLIVQAACRAGIREILGPPNSALEAASHDADLVFVPEGFADRTYEADGALTPRTIPGAVVADEEAVKTAALQMALTGKVKARSGEVLNLGINTICLHSDTPGAVEHAAHLRKALEAAGIRVKS